MCSTSPTDSGGFPAPSGAKMAVPRSARSWHRPATVATDPAWADQAGRAGRRSTDAESVGVVCRRTVSPCCGDTDALTSLAFRSYCDNLLPVPNAEDWPNRKLLGPRDQRRLEDFRRRHSSRTPVHHLPVRSLTSRRRKRRENYFPSRG